MIRLSLLWLFVIFFSVYARRDWYISLCALIALMAFVEHPDFPKSLMGVQGLNPWNVLLLATTLAWLGARRREGLLWDLPSNMNWYLIGFFAVIGIAFVRSAGDLGSIVEFEILRNNDPPSYANLFSEQIINCLKWVVPGLLLFHGCNSESRLRLAILSIGLVYLLLAVQVAVWMPISAITGGEGLSARSLKILPNEVGYHRVNLSMILAGASWAMFSVRGLVSSNFPRLLVYASILAVLFAQALTGGRMGYITWVVIALVFGFLKWRKILLLAPIAAALLIALIPAMQERITEGFTEESMTSGSRIEAYQYRSDDEADLYTITAGRTFAWGFVVEEILEAPMLGHGRQAMVTTGIAPFLYSEYGESFPHPHNAYLQWILDNGLIGTIPVFFLFLFVVRRSLNLLRCEQSTICVATAGFALSLILALLVAAMGSQTFYPREGAVGMWCAMGLALRVYVQWQRWLDAGHAVESIDGNENFWRLRQDAIGTAR